MENLVLRVGTLIVTGHGDSYGEPRARLAPLSVPEALIAHSLLDVSLLQWLSGRQARRGRRRRVPSRRDVVRPIPRMSQLT